MKSLINRIAVAFLITSLASVSAFAKTKKETVSFPTDISVNGTVIKKGVYDVKYDDQAGELTIVKNNKVLAKAATSIAKRDRKAREFQLRSFASGAETQLIGVTFAGSDHNVLIGNSNASR